MKTQPKYEHWRFCVTEVTIWALWGGGFHPPKKCVCEPGNRVPNLASVRHSVVFQAVAGCTGAHFPFYLVISQRWIVFVLALRTDSRVVSAACWERQSSRVTFPSQDLFLLLSLNYELTKLVPVQKDDMAPLGANHATDYKDTRNSMSWTRKQWSPQAGLWWGARMMRTPETQLLPALTPKKNVSWRSLHAAS